MKLSWGTGIAIVYGVFVLGMLGAVFASRQYDPGLVRKDYYDLDIHYQERMDRKQNTAETPAGLPVRYDAAQHAIVVQFPEGGAPRGNIKLYRSSTLADDMQLDIQADETGRMLIPTTKLVNGIWHIEIEWTTAGKDYFKEQLITITNA